MSKHAIYPLRHYLYAFNSKNITFTRVKRNFEGRNGDFIKGCFENVTKLLQNVKITL